MRLVMLLVSLFLITGCGANFAEVVKGNASVELACSKDQIKIVREAQYSGGGVFAIDACGAKATYECMGTVCTKACSYTPVKSDYSGEGETKGSYHKTVMRRAAVEFECTDIKQISHSDSRGQGIYMIDACGNKAKYQCMGSVCNLSCN